MSLEPAKTVATIFESARMISPRKGTEVNARGLRVTFSQGMKEAFGELADVVQTDEHFDGDVYRTLHSWSSDEAPTVHDVFTSFPLIAQELAGHVSRAADPVASDIWHSICILMPEQGFTLSKVRELDR